MRKIFLFKSRFGHAEKTHDCDIHVANDLIEDAISTYQKVFKKKEPSIEETRQLDPTMAELELVFCERKTHDTLDGVCPDTLAGSSPPSSSPSASISPSTMNSNTRSTP